MIVSYEPISSVGPLKLTNRPNLIFCGRYKINRIMGHQYFFRKIVPVIYLNCVNQSKYIPSPPRIQPASFQFVSSR